MEIQRHPDNISRDHLSMEAAPANPTLLYSTNHSGGYPLSSILFTTYIRNIPKPQDHRVFNAIYADDTAIVAIFRHSKHAAELAQIHLVKIEEFVCTWGLKINPRKTQAIAFTRAHQELQHKITVARTRVKWSYQIEYLGMMLDKRLTFSEYLKGARIRAMDRILHIRSIVTYASPSWVTAAPSHIQSLVRVQWCPRLLLHVPRRTGLAALKTLVDRSAGVLRQAEQGFLRENPC
ncbi:hypothetical protein Trydic_g1876 [Trypoxylus dichotomus]